MQAKDAPVGLEGLGQTPQLPAPLVASVAGSSLNLHRNHDAFRRNGRVARQSRESCKSMLCNFLNFASRGYLHEVWDSNTMNILIFCGTFINITELPKSHFVLRQVIFIGIPCWSACLRCFFYSGAFPIVFSTAKLSSNLPGFVLRPQNTPEALNHAPCCICVRHRCRSPGHSLRPPAGRPAHCPPCWPRWISPGEITRGAEVQRRNGLLDNKEGKVLGHQKNCTRSKFLWSSSKFFSLEIIFTSTSSAQDISSKHYYSHESLAN